tara:strand:- start:14 stop:343 length:330 start_codon:yes stop_codon:yes gene_type:complete
MASPPKITMGSQAPRKAEKFDLLTNTENILSKKIKRNPKKIPKAKFTPIPPLLLKEETDTPIRVKTKAEKGKLHLLCLTNRWLFIITDPPSCSFSMNSFRGEKVKVSAL